jgi:hypothetical protein
MRLHVCVAFAVAAALGAPAERLDSEDERTPRAGEAYGDTFLGQPLDAPSRDRRKITDLVLYGILAPGGPDERTASPQGALFLWRNVQGEGRLRAVLAGLLDDVRYNMPFPNGTGFETVATFENTTLPWARSEYVEGVRIASEELNDLSVRAGAGFAYRVPLAPAHQDNAFEAALTYEMGYLFFGKGGDTSSAFRMPSETWEDRFHLRLRADALERNIMELPHSGWAAGADLIHGHRTEWTDWGGPVTGLNSGEEGRNWGTASAYAVAAIPLPFGRTERHRLIAMAHGGIGKDLDRFSSFRLGGGSTWGDFETLARPELAGAAADEFTTSRYGIVDLEYRYQAAFFLYLQVRGTLAWLEVPCFEAGGIVNRVEPMHAVTTGLSTGLPWTMALEAAVTYNFGLVRPGHEGTGALGILVGLFKEF